MHFQVQMTVGLRTPMTVCDTGDKRADGRATHYVIIIGVNALDIGEAVALAQEIALCPKDGDGNRTPHDGYVEEAEAKAIEKEHWAPEILAGAVHIDRPGVYSSTGLIFFDDDETEPPKKWWQFWK